MADAAAGRQWLLPLVGFSGILVAKVANCSKRELAYRAHAEPIRQVLRGQSTEHASIGRSLVAQGQEYKLEVENVAVSAAAAGAGNSSDRFARHCSDKIVDAARAFPVPKVK